jgi:hypothetical protein
MAPIARKAVEMGKAMTQCVSSADGIHGLAPVEYGIELEGVATAKACTRTPSLKLFLIRRRFVLATEEEDNLANFLSHHRAPPFLNPSLSARDVAIHIELSHW